MVMQPKHAVQICKCIILFKRTTTKNELSWIKLSVCCVAVCAAARYKNYCNDAVLLCCAFDIHSTHESNYFVGRSTVLLFFASHSPIMAFNSLFYHLLYCSFATNEEVRANAWHCHSNHNHMD